MRASLLQQWILIFALWAVMLMGIVPSGYMINPDSGKITICTLTGAQEIPVSDTSAPVKKNSFGSCAFSGFSGEAFLFGVMAVMAAVLWPLFIKINILQHFFPSRRIFIGSHSAQGPPHTL